MREGGVGVMSNTMVIDRERESIDYNLKILQTYVKNELCSINCKAYEIMGYLPSNISPWVLCMKPSSNSSAM